MMNEFHDLLSAIHQALKRCLDVGMHPPLYLAAIGSNGALFYGRYTQGDECLEFEKLAGYAVDDGAFVLPTALVIVDKQGEAAKVTVSHRGVSFTH